MTRTIDEILNDVTSITQSSLESDPKQNAFVVLQISAATNSTAKQLYQKWENSYREKINTSIVNAAKNNELTSGFKEADIESVFQIEPDPTKPDQGQAYQILANQLRDYYERFEDDDDSPWWRR